MRNWHRFFFGNSAPWYCLAAALLVLIGWLGGHPIWTQEYRWQQVCLHMLATHDYFHPYLDGHPYYDKPLLSYWLMLAMTPFSGGLTLTALRLPSVLAAGLTLYSVFFIGRFYVNRTTGLLAAWLLLTTFYFVFWGRVASADMLNVAAIVGGVAWLLARQERLWQWRSQVGFWLVVVIGALLKGLIAPVLLAVIMLPWLLQEKRYQAFWHWRSLLLAVLAMALYLSPFILSNVLLPHHYQENGLQQVFQENIVRFFKPFDHQGGIQTYFIYAPVYLLPWTPLWLMAVVKTIRQWRHMPFAGRWLMWASVSIFVFLSLSGSRRSYYILPMVPFAVLQMAYCWQQGSVYSWVKSQRLFILLAIFYIMLVAYFVVGQPWYYAGHQ